MTLILGSLLAFVSESLKEKQEAEREFERKKFILSAALGTEEISSMANRDRNLVNDIYTNRVNDFVVGLDGSKFDGMTAKDVIVFKQYKKLDPADHTKAKAGETVQLPVYTVSKEGSKEVEFYVLPIYGFGLWDNIWGYLSIQSDLNTVQGVIFDHKGETPGLGARITETEVQNRYRGKQLFSKDGSFNSVNMAKGEGVDYSSDSHTVNGLTGATITANGVNIMVSDYVKLYSNYLNSLKG